MRKKEVIQIILSIVILVVVAVLIYSYLVPPPKDNGVKVEVPRKVITSFDQKDVKKLSELKDYTQNLDVGTVGKPKPF